MQDALPFDQVLRVRILDRDRMRYWALVLDYYWMTVLELWDTVLQGSSYWIAVLDTGYEVLDLSYWI